MIISLLFYNNGWCQEHLIDLYNLNYRINKGVKNSTSSNIHIKVHFDDGTPAETLYYRPIRNRGDSENNKRMPTIRVFSKPVKIDCFVFVNFRTGTDAHSGTPPKDPILINDSCLEGYYENSYSPRMTKITFEYKITPVLSINNPGADNTIGYDDSFRVSAIDGYSGSTYNWQYQVVEFGGPTSFNWNDMPSSTGANGNHTFEVTPSQFLSRNDIGKRIYFRINMCNDNNTSVIYYNLKESAPHITNIESKGTTCFDSSDGEVTLTFDRPLIASNSEVLSIKIEDLSRPNGINPNGTIRYREVGGVNNIIAFDTNNSITIDNLPKSSTQFRVVITGTSNGETYYTGGVDHTRVFTIAHNPPVAFKEKPSKVDVWCHGGADGEATLKAQGGTGNNYHYKWRVVGGTFSDWIPFDIRTSDTQVIKNLAPNTYEYKISDGNLCAAREQVDVAGQIELRGEIIESVEIKAPNEALLLEYTDAKEPTAFGLKDGYIVAKVTGGTIKNDNSYNYVWKDQNNNILNSITTEFTSGAYYIKLNNIGAGTYNLTITDKNYIEATDKEGCTIVDASYFLDQPKPLSVKIEIYKEISCNGSNDYDSEVDDDGNGIPNEAQNGALVAHAEGGIKLSASDNGGLPYYYTWKKKDTDGNWITMSQTDSIASNLNVGDYALNIKDKNGIVLGEYVNNVLIREIDSTFYLPEPPKLLINTTANQITCASGKNGKVKTVVSGGTPPYNYLWNTGDTTAEVDSLYAGKYFVFVTDSKGCQIQDNVTIVQPEGINIELIRKKDPTCSYSTDGSIEVAITGGTPPYRLKWNNNKTTSTINNLVAGDYELNVVDANDCNAFFDITLESATPLEINLGADRTLCGGQSITLDGTIAESGATYDWSGPNGFVSNNPITEISEAGTYTITVTSLKGCVATDEIVITTKDVAIDASFLLASQAYTNTSIELANVSNPKGETTEWVVPSDAVIIDKNDDHISFKFEKAGIYEVSLISYVEDCYKVVTKNILVEENTNLPDVGDADNPFITEFTVYPNPNNGTFKAKVALKEESAISLRFVNILTNEVVVRKEEIGNKEYLIDYNTNLAPGVYFIVLETPEGTETRKVIIQ